MSDNQSTYWILLFLTLLVHLSLKNKINLHLDSAQSPASCGFPWPSFISCPLVPSSLHTLITLPSWEHWHLDPSVSRWVASNNLALTPVIFIFTSHKSPPMPGCHRSQCSTNISLAEFIGDLYIAKCEGCFRNSDLLGCFLTSATNSLHTKWISNNSSQFWH